MFMIWAWMGTCLDYEGEKKSYFTVSQPNLFKQ